jgi:hypothetical protein
MFAENRHYGHAEILLAYCGLPPETEIPVRMQHGWQPGFGMRPQDMAQPGPKIVGSSRNLARAHAAGYADALAGLVAEEFGRVFFLFGPPTGLSASDDPTGERFDRWQRESFPQLCWERFDETVHIELGASELGREHKRSPAQLRDELLLGPAHATTRTKLKVARSVDTAAKLAATLTVRRGP